jgi:(p)ppGpp synthase/HD superfamily hydrolase
VVTPAELLRALAFAAGKHRDQRRKDLHASPYINHPIAVAAVLAQEGGISDAETLTAAILHDTIEDTETSGEEIEAIFGGRVRRIVEEVTDDKSLPKDERKRLQVVHAPAMSAEARLVKLADKISNLHDLLYAPPVGWPLARRRDYLEWTAAVVAGCRGVNAALERRFDELLAEGRLTLGD